MLAWRSPTAIRERGPDAPPQAPGLNGAAVRDASAPLPAGPQRQATAETEKAVLRTLAYADVFEFPLDRREIFRYCVSPAGSSADVNAAIDSLLARGSIGAHGGYLFLPGRHSTVLSRRRLSHASQAAWREARRWGRVFWTVPFVRMVAVTGSLAAGAAGADGDIDYMIVVEPGRLWLTRALCLLIWRVALLRGTRLCPNYFITTRALTVERHDLYTARELAQMVPLHGRSVALALEACNRWSLELLPNARLEVDKVSDSLSPPSRALKQGGERLLGGRLADRLEGWERNRKVPRLVAEAAGVQESAFAADVCKDHAHAHGSQVLKLYGERVSELERVGGTFAVTSACPAFTAD